MFLSRAMRVRVSREIQRHLLFYMNIYKGFLSQPNERKKKNIRWVSIKENPTSFLLDSICVMKAPKYVKDSEIFLRTALCFFLSFTFNTIGPSKRNVTISLIPSENYLSVSRRRTHLAYSQLFYEWLSNLETRVLQTDEFSRASSRYMSAARKSRELNGSQLGTGDVSNRRNYGFFPQQRRSVGCFWRGARRGKKLPDFSDEKLM